MHLFVNSQYSILFEPSLLFCLIPITKEKQYNKACCVIIFSGDSMAHHNGRKFSAKDIDVDAAKHELHEALKTEYNTYTSKHSIF
jgi:hypothetical protein